MNEKPLERLNFFNGQRLQADDLRLEQDYHMRVRRWLNRSLYTSGIADGLEVHKVPNAPKVRVGPGLALDNFGREIIQLQMQELVVPGTLDHEGKPTEKNKPVGLYLTVRYGESTTARQDGVCPGPDRPVSGGPSRVMAEPVFEWSADLPHGESGKVLLALVGLGKGCRDVSLLDLTVRPLAAPAITSAVRQYALEGFRDIDESNPGRIFFHVRGRQPTSVLLSLRAAPFPSFHYTALGKHSHTLDIRLQGADGRHAHELGKYSIPLSGQHANGIPDPFVSGEFYAGAEDLVSAAKTALNIATLGIGDISPSPPVAWHLVATPVRTYTVTVAGQTVGTFDLPDAKSITTEPSFSTSTDGSHSHEYGSSDTTKLNTVANDANSAHTHAFAATGAAPAGVGPNAFAEADGYTAISLVHDLRVRIGSVDQISAPATATDRTQLILQQLRASQPTENWLVLGTGKDEVSNTLQRRGTGLIRLHYLRGLNLTEGEYFIELISPPSMINKPNGGRIHFNLYIE